MDRLADKRETVYVVDDDPAVRHAMRLLLESVGLRAETFPTADEFLERFDADRKGCLVLDIRMPGLSGFELQERLTQTSASMPVIFITGHADVPMAVEAMRRGAFDFIQKPFRDQELLDTVTRAVQADLHRRPERVRCSELAARLNTLTRREREVMDLVVAGKRNKVIAYDLGTSQRTVEIHRGRVMEKMRARSLPELVRVSVNLKAVER